MGGGPRLGEQPLCEEFRLAAKLLAGPLPSSPDRSLPVPCSPPVTTRRPGRAGGAGRQPPPQLFPTGHSPDRPGGALMRARDGGGALSKGRPAPCCDMCPFTGGGG